MSNCYRTGKHEMDGESFSEPQVQSFRRHFRAPDSEIQYDGGPRKEKKIDHRADQQIASPIRNFLISFYNAFRDKNPHELQNLYESNWPMLSEKYFSKSRLPEVEIIEQMIGNCDDEIFFVIYKWLYYRHIYEYLKPSLNDIIECYTNYCDFFNYILTLNNEGCPRDIELPNKLIWDIMNDFIVQFENVSLMRRKQSGMSPEEIEFLKDKSDTWDVHSILNVLYSIIHTSKINKQLAASTSGGDIASSAGPYGTKPLYRMLGYSSLICLMRVQCSLGDYLLALRAVENVDFGKKNLFARTYSCNVTTYYYLGFIYMILRRYSDAIATFVHLLLYVSRIKQSNLVSIVREEISRKCDSAYALLAICVSITRQRIDESVHNTLREKHGESIIKMQKDVNEAVEVVTNLFVFACPVFISPGIVNYGSTADTSLVPLNYQIDCFVYDVRLQLYASYTASRLRHYTAIEIEKLASFLGKTVESTISELIVFKNRCNERKKLSENSQDGFAAVPEIDFYISEGVVYVFKEKQARRIGDWLIRNTNRLNGNYLIQCIWLRSPN